MEKKVKINIFAVAVVLLLSYFELGVIRSYIFPHFIVQIGALLISFAIFFSYAKEIKVTLYEFMWFLAVSGFVVFRNRYLAIGEFDTNIIYYYLLCGILVFTRKQTDWVHYFIDFLFWISLFHAIVTIVFSLNSNLYLSFIRLFMHGDLLRSNLYHYNEGAVAGLFSNYGANACVLSIGTGIMVIRTIIEGKKNLKKNIIHLVVRLLALLFTGKRSPVIMMVIALVLIYLFIEKRNSIKKISRIVLAGGVLFLVFIFVVPFIPQLTVLSNRLMDTEDWTTLGGRTQLYELAFTMIANNPLLGNGWNSYKLVSARTIGRNYPPQFARMQTHNIYLQLMSEVGVVGLVWIICLFLIPIKNTFHICRKYRLDTLKTYIGEELVIGLISTLFILIFFLLYGFTGNPLYDAYMYFLAFLSCGAMRGINNLVMEKSTEEIAD